MPLFPDRAVVINLERRPDRRREFFDSWAASGWRATFLGDPHVFTAVDGFTGLTRREIPRHLRDSPGVHGCWASHVAVLQQALADGVGVLAVFEDDARFPAGSWRWLREVLSSLPKGVDGLWLDASDLGRRNRLMPGTFGTSRLMHPPMRTHAYVVTNRFIERLLPVITAAPTHIDRLFAVAGAGASVYAATPSLSQQADGSTDVQVWAQQLVVAAAATGHQASKDTLWLRRLTPRV